MIVPHPDPTERVPPLELGAALLLISFATVLFTLGIWKLLSFFIMPSLFFDLLFVGFPAGAFLGVKLFRVSLRSFLRTLWILQGAMLLSIAACLLCKHADYLRAHLFEVKLPRLMGQMGTFTVLFIPFFCAYGLSEYVGYQLGTARLGGRMRYVYAVYLFGAAFAYLLLQPALRRVGITGVIAVSVGLVALSTLLLSSSARDRAILGAECVLLLGVFLIWPGSGRVEARFLALYKGKGMQSTRELAEESGYHLKFQRWGRYSLTEILFSEQENQFAGFYNDFMQWEFTKNTGFAARMLGAVPINTAPPGGRIAIIGAGGGRQVKWALHPRFTFKEILALELEPAVLEAVREDLREEFGRVYEAPNVRAVCREARGYMESSTERFDLIFMPSVGGYPQMMLEPGNMIRTSDAYRTLKNRLSDRGILAIWYPSGLDPVEILTQQYVRTLGAQGLGMKTVAFRNDHEYLILAARDPGTKLPSADEIDAFLRSDDDPSGLPPRREPEARTRSLFEVPDPAFKPITDEQPFLAGNVRHIFSFAQLYTLFGVVGGVLLALGGGIFLLLRRSGDPGIPCRSYGSVAVLSLLIGANFILFEHFVVLALFKKLYVFQDALALGAVSFLVVSGLGSVVITPRNRLAFQLLAVLCLVPVLCLEKLLPAWGLLLLVLPVAFATGSFFPAVFELAVRNPLAVFAMDAVGAAIGSAVAFFIPIAFGFSVQVHIPFSIAHFFNIPAEFSLFFPIAALAFVVTASLTWRFCRHHRALPPRPLATAKQVSSK